MRHGPVVHYADGVLKVRRGWSVTRMEESELSVCVSDGENVDSGPFSRRWNVMSRRCSGLSTMVWSTWSVTRMDDDQWSEYSQWVVWYADGIRRTDDIIF